MFVYSLRIGGVWSINAPRWDDTNIRAYGAQSLLEVMRYLVSRGPNGAPVKLATISTLISALVAYDVTDSLDAIYAILHLGKDTIDPLLTPDYKNPKSAKIKRWDQPISSIPRLQSKSTGSLSDMLLASHIL